MRKTPLLLICLLCLALALPGLALDLPLEIGAKQLGGSLDEGMQRQALFPYGNQLNLSYWSNALDHEQGAEPLFLSCLPGEDPLVLLRLRLLAINPASQNTAHAGRFLSAYLDAMDDMETLLLYPDMDKALPDPAYPQRLQRSQAYLDALKKKAALAEGAQKSQTMQQVQEAEAQQAQWQEKGRWLVNQAVVDRLKALLADAVLVDSALSQVYQAGAQGILERALLGGQPLQVAAQELDARLRLLQEENR